MSKEIPGISRQERFIKRATRLTSITLFTIQPEDVLMFFLTIALSYGLAGLALRPLKKIIESQKYFLADASHELRIPLSIIKLDMEVFLKETIHNFTSKKHLLETRHQAARSNIEELERMQQMLDNLLILSREDTYQEGTTNKQYNLATVLSQIMMRLHDSAKRKHIDLSISGSKDIFLFGDSIRIEQAILNIAKNAIKYTNKGGMIVIEVVKDVTQVRVTIRDNGIGIAAKDLPYVFKRFFRAKNAVTEKTEGMGLGLTITKMILEKHKGKIDIQSMLGKGTTVTVYLSYGNKK